MECPARFVRECDEWTRHQEQMYLHLRDEHTRDEMARALLALTFAIVDIKVASSEKLIAAARDLPMLEALLMRTLRNFPEQICRRCSASMKYTSDVGGANAFLECRSCDVRVEFEPDEGQ